MCGVSPSSVEERSWRLYVWQYSCTIWYNLLAVGEFKWNDDDGNDLSSTASSRKYHEEAKAMPDREQPMKSHQPASRTHQCSNQRIPRGIHYNCDADWWVFWKNKTRSKHESITGHSSNVQYSQILGCWKDNNRHYSQQDSILGYCRNDGIWTNSGL